MPDETKTSGRPDTPRRRARLAEREGRPNRPGMGRRADRPELEDPDLADPNDPAGGDVLRALPRRATQRLPRDPEPAFDDDVLDDDGETMPDYTLDQASGSVFAAGPIDALTPQQERFLSRTTRISFLLAVVLPVIASAFYLFLIAADRYAVEVKFAIRSPAGTQSGDLLGAITGGATSGASQSDSYMVVEYLQSRQFLDELSTRLNIESIYARDDADFLMRLSAGSAKEDQVSYLGRVIHPTFDSTSQIITVESQAFAPEDAYRVAQGVLDTASQMVNRLSEQARQDTLRLAQAEVDRAEAALKAQRAAIAAFRESEQRIDPQQSVAAQENVVASLQSSLATAEAEMRSLRSFLSPDAPSIKVLESRIASIEKQIAAERANLVTEREAPATGAASDASTPPIAAGSLNSAVSLYEALAVDLDFHQQTYVSALASLESARIEADRQQRYLAAVVLPALPEKASYPQHFLTLSLIAAIAFLIWGIVAMLIHVIREHLR